MEKFIIKIKGDENNANVTTWFCTQYNYRNQ